MSVFWDSIEWRTGHCGSFVKNSDYTLVSLDADLADLAALIGPPPRLIWLRCGNQWTGFIENLLRVHADTITAFEVGSAACLEIY
jgi:predicted nuclease of predicted toxin-antitoxin system